MAHEVKIHALAKMDAVAAAHLSKIDGVDNEVVDFYSKDLSVSGRMLFAFIHDGKRVGAMVVSVSRELSDTFLVVDEAYCRPIAGYCMADHIECWARKMAPDMGCNKIRFWTARTGFLRFVKDRFRVRYVMEADL